MEVLFIILSGLFGAGLVMGGVTGFKGVKQFFVVGRSLKALNRSQFSSVLKSVDWSELKTVTEAKQVVAVPKMLELTAVKVEGMSASELLDYLSSSSLPNVLQRKAVAVSQLISQAVDGSLTVEQGHDVGVVVEQLFSSVRLFEGLPVKHQTKALGRELLQQWGTLESAVQGIIDSRVKADVNALQAGSSFVALKFRKGFQLR